MPWPRRSRADPDVAVVATVRGVARVNDGIDVDFDICLYALHLPDGNGADATRTLKQRWPHRKRCRAQRCNQPISRSTRLRRAGADAIVGRDESIGELVAVLRAIDRSAPRMSMRRLRNDGRAVEVAARRRAIRRPRH